MQILYGAAPDLMRPWTRSLRQRGWIADFADPKRRKRTGGVQVADRRSPWLSTVNVSLFTAFVKPSQGLRGPAGDEETRLKNEGW